MGAEPVVADSNTIWLTENCTTDSRLEDRLADWGWGEGRLLLAIEIFEVIKAFWVNISKAMDHKCFTSPNKELLNIMFPSKRYVLLLGVTNLILVFYPRPLQHCYITTPDALDLSFHWQQAVQIISEQLYHLCFLMAVYPTLVSHVNLREGQNLSGRLHGETLYLTSECGGQACSHWPSVCSIEGVGPKVAA